MRYVVDGISATENEFVGDGWLPPFVVFDCEAQEIVAGPFGNANEAEAHRTEIENGGKPRLDAEQLSSWLERLDEENDAG